VEEYAREYFEKMITQNVYDSSTQIFVWAVLRVSPKAVLTRVDTFRHWAQRFIDNLNYLKTCK